MICMEEFAQALRNSTKETILSEKLFRLALDASDKLDELQRMDMLKHQACQVYGIPLEQVEDWIERAYDSQGHDTGEKGKRRLSLLSGRALQEKEFPPLEFIVEGLLAPGLALLVAPSKAGKSWMVLDLCLSVAEGRPFLGYRTHKGSTLYLALEDTGRRLKERQDKILKGRRAPEGFFTAFRAGKIGDGLIEELESVVEDCPELKLIVVDTLQMVRSNASCRENAYAADYAAMSKVKQFADQHSLCVLLVHHTRKNGDDNDPFNRINGTTGIIGAADTCIMLERPARAEQTATLSVIGRDIMDQNKVVRFNSTLFQWELLGDAAQLDAQRERQEYDQDRIVLTIRMLLDQAEHHTWTGSASELMKLVQETDPTYQCTTQKMGRELRRLEPLLLQYDGIAHSRAGNGTGGAPHTFSKVGTQQSLMSKQTL